MIPRHHLVLPFMCLCGLFSTVTVAGPTDSPVIANGDTPRDGQVQLQLQEQWRIGGPDDEDNLLGVINQVLTDDDGNFYLLDIQLTQVLVFDTDGIQVNSLGQQGDGPGEIRRAVDIVLLPDGTLGLVQGFPGRVVQVTLDGVPAGEFQPGFHDPEQGGFFALDSVKTALGNLYLSGRHISRGEETRVANKFVSAMSMDLEPLASFHEGVSERRRGGGPYVEKEDYFPNGRRWDVNDTGWTCIATDRNRYSIAVHSPDGALQRTITRDYQSWERSDQDMDRAKSSVMPWRRRNRHRINFQMESTEPDIIQIRATNDGRIWVLPSRGVRNQPAGVHSTWDVFDVDGRFVQSVAVACDSDGLTDRIFFVDDEYLVLVREHEGALRAFRGQNSEEEELDLLEEEISPLEVICYKMETF